MTYRQLNVSETNRTIIIYLKPNRPQDIYTVMFNKGSQPNKSHHLMKTDWPDDQLLSIYRKSSSNLPDELPYMLTVPEAYTQENGTYYVGVELKGWS